MNQQRLLFGGLALLIVVGLIVINAASFVELSPKPELEARPNRSSFNAGPTGTRAWFEYLQDSGTRVMRWDKSLTELPATITNTSPKTLVIVGRTLVPLEPQDMYAIKRWVSAGGRLVVVDRFIDQKSLPTATGWTINSVTSNYAPLELRADDQTALLADAAPVAITQTSKLANNVVTLQPSRFASQLILSFKASDIESSDDANEEAEDEPTPVQRKISNSAAPNSTPSELEPVMQAPVVHANLRGLPLLVDYAYGNGRVIVLTDPYMVSNAGLDLGDNLFLAQNLLAADEGVVAFDEYHQGHIGMNNGLVAYFADTPFVPLLVQLLLVVGAVIWSRSVRFARPLPVDDIDRRSKLEYVDSMADLQHRSRAYDLALENVYLRIKRVLARYGGVDIRADSRTIAERAAARSKLDAGELSSLLDQCEAIVHGDATTATQTLALVTKLRAVERALGLGTRTREAKQAAVEKQV